MTHRASFLGAKTNAGGAVLARAGRFEIVTGDRDPVALALKIKTSRWSFKDPLRNLIRKMSLANSWGAPRIHSELIKLGIDVEKTTVEVTDIARGRRLPP